MTSPFTSSDDVEKAFYAAFVRCDANAMGKLWAEGEVICVHPGSSAIVGHTAVMRSWEHIFQNAQMPDMQVRVLNKTVSVTLAVHVVEEYIASDSDTMAVVLATNVYQKFTSEWLMVEHHGSVIRTQAEKHTVQ